MLFVIVGAAVWAYAEYGVSRDNNPGIHSSLANVKEGECYANPGTGKQYVMDPVGCGHANTVRVVAVVELSIEGPFPGAGAMDAQAQARCPETTDTWLVPTKDSWPAKNGRRIICLQDT